MSRVSELTGARHDGNVLGDGKTRPAKFTRVSAMNISDAEAAAKDAEIARLKAEVDGLRHARATLHCEIDELRTAMKSDDEVICDLDAEIARLKEQIENRTVLESYLPIFKKLAGTGYGIATSGFCEDVCNALKQRSDKAELIKILQSTKDELLAARHSLDWTKAERGELVEALKKYAEHDKNCGMRRIYRADCFKHTCTCGLLDALKKVGAE